MSYVIAEPCVDHTDQSCIAVCPVDAISLEPGVDRKAYIDPDACVECGSCMSVCPNGAIYPDGQLPQEFADYAWIDAAWFRNRGAARAVLEEVMTLQMLAMAS